MDLRSGVSNDGGVLSSLFISCDVGYNLLAGDGMGLLCGENKHLAALSAWGDLKIHIMHEISCHILDKK